MGVQLQTNQLEVKERVRGGVVIKWKKCLDSKNTLQLKTRIHDRLYVQSERGEYVHDDPEVSEVCFLMLGGTIY